MGRADWQPRKPFDIRARLFEFGCLVIRLVQHLHTRGPVAAALAYQLLHAGTSAGANYEEADDGSSARDALAKKRIVLRELKELRFRYRLLRACGYLTREHDPVGIESDEPRQNRGRDRSCREPETTGRRPKVIGNWDLGLWKFSANASTAPFAAPRSS